MLVEVGRKGPQQFLNPEWDSMERGSICGWLVQEMYCAAFHEAYTCGPSDNSASLDQGIEPK